jgi:hypothetical protein
MNCFYKKLSASLLLLPILLSSLIVYPAERYYNDYRRESYYPSWQDYKIRNNYNYNNYQNTDKSVSFWQKTNNWFNSILNKPLNNFAIQTKLAVQSAAAYLPLLLTHLPQSQAIKVSPLKEIKPLSAGIEPKLQKFQTQSAKLESQPQPKHKFTNQEFMEFFNLPDDSHTEKNNANTINPTQTKDKEPVFLEKNAPAGKLITEIKPQLNQPEIIKETQKFPPTQVVQPNSRIIPGDNWETVKQQLPQKLITNTDENTRSQPKTLTGLLTTTAKNLIKTIGQDLTASSLSASGQDWDNLITDWGTKTDKKIETWTIKNVKNQNLQVITGFSVGLIQGLSDTIAKDCPAFILQTPKLIKQLLTDKTTLKKLCDSLGASFEQVYKELNHLYNGDVTTYHAGQTIGYGIGKIIGWAITAKVGTNAVEKISAIPAVNKPLLWVKNSQE